MGGAFFLKMRQHEDKGQTQKIPPFLFSRKSALCLYVGGGGETHNAPRLGRFPLLYNGHGELL